MTSRILAATLLASFLAFATIRCGATASDSTSDPGAGGQMDPPASSAPDGSTPTGDRDAHSLADGGACTTTVAISDTPLTTLACTVRREPGQPVLRLLAPLNDDGKIPFVVRFDFLPEGAVAAGTFREDDSTMQVVALERLSDGGNRTWRATGNATMPPARLGTYELVIESVPPTGIDNVVHGRFAATLEPFGAPAGTPAADVRATF